MATTTIAATKAATTAIAATQRQPAALVATAAARHFAIQKMVSGRRRRKRRRAGWVCKKQPSLCVRERDKDHMSSLFIIFGIWKGILKASDDKNQKKEKKEGM